MVLEEYDFFGWMCLLLAGDKFPVPINTPGCSHSPSHYSPLCHTYFKMQQSCTQGSWWVRDLGNPSALNPRGSMRFSSPVPGKQLCQRHREEEHGFVPDCITWSEREPSLEKAVLAMRITEFQLPSVAAEGFPLPSEV